MILTLEEEVQLLKRLLTEKEYEASMMRAKLTELQEKLMKAKNESLHAGRMR